MTMQDESIIVKQLSIEKPEPAERESRELQDADLEEVSGGTIVLDE